jgi:hypothetical protein
MSSAKWFLLALGLLGAAHPAAGQTDCYFAELPNALVVGNSRVEIRLDPESGVITGLLNRATGTELVGHGPSEVFRLVYSTPQFHGSPADDPWSAVEGTLVKGALQRVAATRLARTAEGIRLEVSYDHLRLERRALDVSVYYTIELRDGDEETRWRLAIQNRDQGTVREVHFPLVSGLSELDTLIMPNESGQKVQDPIHQLSDEIPVMSLEYPGRGSMQWFEYYSDAVGLYMASYDSDLAYTRMCFGRTGEGPEAAMWIVKYPFTPSGVTWQSPELALGIHAGDWHWGADRYRAWFESWSRKPDVPLEVQEMIGGLREIMIKRPDGEVSHEYASMVTLARQVSASPHGGPFLVAGWMHDGHDTYYPEYVPIPELGGREALVAALDGVHEQGAAATAYVNGRISNVETETYKTHGKGWSVLGRAPGLGVNSTDFFELHEEWNRSWGERPGQGWFAVMCPSARGWQDHLIGEVSRVVGDYGFDGVFLDQPGSYYGELCYNRSHGHDTPASAWGPGLLELFRRLRQRTRELDSESILWTEGMNDAFGQYMDYGMDKNPLWRPMRIHPGCESFVEMWRYTLPDRIIVNDSGAYAFAPSHDRIYGDSYLFVLGVRGLSRSGERGIQSSTEEDGVSVRRRAVIEKIERLWMDGGPYLFHGRFMDDVGLRVSTADVLAKVYRGERGVAMPVWNTTAAPVTFDLEVDLGALGVERLSRPGARSLDTGRPLSLRTSGDVFEVKVRLPPHEIDVVVLEGEGRSAHSD